MGEKRTETTEIIKDEKGNIIKETKTIVIEKETVIEKQDYIPCPYPQPHVSYGDNISLATVTDNDNIFTIC